MTGIPTNDSKTANTDAKRPVGSISLDLDNQWSYMKVHGDSGWEDYPSYLDRFLPYVLSELKQLDLSITFFIVGKDADSPENADSLKEIVNHGHEVGNHSYHHESWLKTYSKEMIEQELRRAEKAIISATGERPTGFRGPGFSWSNDLLSTLAEMGYAYDASTLPTYLGPIARRYYFMTAKLSDKEKKERKELFGTFADGLRPIKPYLWQLAGDGQLLEIPVTTIPIIKSPFHLSYLLYLSGFSMTLMRMYLQLAIGLCKLTRTTPSFLLHPLDLIGGDELPELRFFPGMDIESRKKLTVFRYAVRVLQDNFTIGPMGIHARQLLEGDSVKKMSRLPVGM